jgi:hypothetical protein
LLEVLLADASLVGKAAAVVRAEEIEHPGLRKLLQGLYALHARGESPTLDHLRADLQNVRLLAKAFELQEVGLGCPNKEAWLRELLAHFRQRRDKTVKQDLQNQLHASSNHEAALALLRRLQNQSGPVRPEGVGSVELGPDTSSQGDGGSTPLSPFA